MLPEEGHREAGEALVTMLHVESVSRSTPRDQIVPDVHDAAVHQQMAEPRTVERATSLIQPRPHTSGKGDVTTCRSGGDGSSEKRRDE